MTTILKDLNLKIRKQHTCFSCLRKFPPGTIMRYQACIYEGDFCTTYTCDTCQDIMSISNEHEWEEGFVDNQLEHLQTPEELLSYLRTHKR